MKNRDQARRQLSVENEALRQQIAALERSAAQSRQREQDWRYREAQWRSAVENAPLLIASVDREGVIQSVNRAQTGTALQAMLGRSLYDFLDPPCHAAARNCLAGVFQTGRPAMYESIVQRPDGRRVQYVTDVHPVILDGQIVLATLISSDLSERKRAEARLHESQRKLRSLLSNLCGMAYRCNNDPQWTMEFVSEGCRSLTGYESSAMQGNRAISYGAIIHPDDRQMVWERIQQAVGEHGHFRIEYRIRTAQGQEKWVWEQGAGVFSASGELEALEGLIVDITERKLVERNLHESNRRLQALMDASPESIVLMAPDGTILLANQTTARRLGRSVAEIVGRTFHQVLAPDVAAGRMRYFAQAVRTGQPVRFEDMRRGRFMENAVHPILNEQGQVAEVAALSIDLTERKRTEEALQRAHDELETRVQQRTADLSAANDQLTREVQQRRQAEENLALFRRLAESANQGFAISDLSGRVVYMNPALRRLAGVAEDDPNLQTYQTAPAEHRRQLEEEVIPTVLREGQWQGELMHRTPDGTNRFTLNNLFLIRDNAGQPAYIAGSVTDITERKQAEQALRQSHDELRSIYEGSADGILIVNAATGRFLRANPAMCRMLGYSEDRLLALSVHDIHAPEVAMAVLEKFRTQALDQPQLTENRPVLRSDGTLFYADIANTLIQYDDRPCIVGVFRDITERKKAHEALQRERQSLWRMLQASDHERQIIAYEIHDGLAQYLAAAGMQFQAYDSLRDNSPEEAHKVYRTAVELVRQAHFESRRLISEVRPPVIDEIGLETAVSHLVHEQRRHGGPQIKLDSDVQFGRLPAVLENALYRIMQEALANACKHSHSRKVKVTLAQEGDAVRMEVQDWGVGFDPAAVEKGHFGLEGIRQRVRLLDGHMTIESAAGEGTTLSVVVPLLHVHGEQ